MGHGNVHLVYITCTIQMKPVNKLQDNMSNQRLQATSSGKQLIEEECLIELQFAQNIRPASRIQWVSSWQFSG